MKNPLIISKPGLSADIIGKFKDNGIDVKTVFDIQSFNLKGEGNSKKTTEILRSMGYDGVKLSLFENKEVLVFDKGSIKGSDKSKEAAKEITDWTSPEGQAHIMKHQSKMFEKESLTPVGDTYAIPGQRAKQEFEYILAPSAKKKGKWQLSSFNWEGEPFGDREFDTFEEAMEAYKEKIPRRPDIINSVEKKMMDEGRVKLETSYELIRRPRSINTNPTEGLIRHEKGGDRHGYVIYDRMLSQEELDTYELKPIGKKFISAQAAKEHQSAKAEVKQHGQSMGMVEREEKSNPQKQEEDFDWQSIFKKPTEEESRQVQEGVQKEYDTEIEPLRKQLDEFKQKKQEAEQGLKKWMDKKYKDNKTKLTFGDEYDKVTRSIGGINATRRRRNIENSQDAIREYDNLISETNKKIEKLNKQYKNEGVKLHEHIHKN